MLTAVALIGDELGAPAGAAKPRSARASPPRRFTFVRPGIPVRQNGECASLFGAFAVTTPTAKAGLGTGAFLKPNSTGGSVPPAEGPGLQLCQPENGVTFNATFVSLGPVCNRYQVGGAI